MEKKIIDIHKYLYGISGDMKLKFGLLIVLLLLCACSSNGSSEAKNLAEPNKIYGEPVVIDTFPCSAGHGCNAYDGLQVDGQRYRIIKQYIVLEEGQSAFKLYPNLNLDCGNDICGEMCSDNECFENDSEGTFVRGSIVRHEETRNPNFKQYILLE